TRARRRLVVRAWTIGPSQRRQYRKRVRCPSDSHLECQALYCYAQSPLPTCSLRVRNDGSDLSRHRAVHRATILGAWHRDRSKSEGVLDEREELAWRVRRSLPVLLAQRKRAVVPRGAPVVYPRTLGP